MSAKWTRWAVFVLLASVFWTQAEPVATETRPFLWKLETGDATGWTINWIKPGKSSMPVGKGVSRVRF